MPGGWSFWADNSVVKKRDYVDIRSGYSAVSWYRLKSN